MMLLTTQSSWWSNTYYRASAEAISSHKTNIAGGSLTRDSYRSKLPNWQIICPGVDNQLPNQTFERLLGDEGRDLKTMIEFDGVKKIGYALALGLAPAHWHSYASLPKQYIGEGETEIKPEWRVICDSL